MLEILYAEEAHERIAAYNPTLQRRLKEAVERLATHPELGKHLAGHLAGISSYRTGDYRILYRIDRPRQALIVLTIGHRKDVYRRGRP